MRIRNKRTRRGSRGKGRGRGPVVVPVEHEPYIHREDGVSSLRCTCGQWKGRHLVDTAGHAAHVAGIHCSVCGDPAAADPCSPECRNDLALIEGHYCDTPMED